ncbi:unnamed protein product [Cylicostephanus goldi]|uniref:Cadherin domain-containing protein n=1 Tax=Cylicostephanus goldi TaxID=71465 RepID=A0A3P7QJM9_CYLGO|nr:unnamed protein product [Cylicostephanus goldi]
MCGGKSVTINGNDWENLDKGQILEHKDNPPCCASPPCSECFVSIKATDRGIPPLESTALLKVLLTTENLHDPQINIRLHPSNVDFALIETGALADPSPISIESGNEDSIFDLIVQKQFSILKLTKNAENIDRSEFDLQFLAKDGQTPPRVTRRLLKVYNEAKLTASPVMVEKNLAVTLPENSPVGSFVTQVHTNSSNCRFFLSGTTPFHVDELSGKTV